MNTEKVSVSLSQEGFKTTINAGKHRFIADEPEALGGQDLGPSPYDLLLGSLGACTVMTLKMYADRKGWELGEVSVDLSHKKDYYADCEECEKSDTKIDFIDRIIHIHGNVTEEQKERLLKIANKCPVHKTLMTQNIIKTEIS